MNIKKIGLTALAASLVSVSANAGEMSVAGTAKLGVTGHSGTSLNLGTSFTMGNQLTFSGSGELDNGMTVSLTFVQDNGESTFDGHSLSLASDTLGTLEFHGENGSSSSNQVDKTAAGDLWDAFDQLANGAGLTFPDLAQTASAGNNAFIYRSPALMEGLTGTLSYQPQGAGIASGTGYGINYTGFDGLTFNYASTDVVGTTTLTSGDNTVMKASYVYGPVTVGYSTLDHDEGTTDLTGDVKMTSYSLSYTVSDELSITYGNESSDLGSSATDAEIDGISFAYTAGGMTISGSMKEGENLDYSTAQAADIEQWTLGASFAF